MDEASETESQGRASKVDEDGSAIPAIITDEYFEEITSKCQAVRTNWKKYHRFIIIHFVLFVTRRRCAVY